MFPKLTDGKQGLEGVKLELKTDVMSSVSEMEYTTGIILAQTVVVCIVATAIIMCCFFEEQPRKEKTD